MTRHLRPRVIRRPTGSPCGPSSFSPVTAFQSWRRRSATGRRSATPRRGESLSLTFLELERRPPRSRRSPTRTAWAAFARWADGEGFQALPAAPAAVAAYLAARSEAGRSLSSLHLARQAIRAAHIEAGEADPAASEGVRRVLRGLSRQRAGQGGEAAVRRPRSPPKRWPRSELPPATAAQAPPTGRNPPKRPGSGEPWTSPSPPSYGTPCSGAPKRPRSNGPMSSSGRMDRDGSGSAVRRPTRKRRRV